MPADRATHHGRSRALVVAGRCLLWAAVVLVLGRGMVSLFTDPAASGAPAPRAATVGERYPTVAAIAFATRFTADYLTYDETNPGDWATRTAAYGLDLAGGWDGHGTQTVTSVVPTDLEVTGPTSAVVTVAARTTGGWVHVAVPVASTRTGLALTARPALMPNPTLGSAPSVDPGELDPTAAEVVRPTIEAFLTAFAKGDQAVTAALSADGVRLPQLEGGRFILAEVESVTVPKTHGRGRTALVAARWTDTVTGAGLGQTYRVGLTRVGERWLVDSLGAFRPEPPRTKAKTDAKSDSVKEK